MSTFHAVVWMDHAEAHVLMFDSEHVQGERVHSRSKHSHQGKHPDNKAFYGEIVQAWDGLRGHRLMAEICDPMHFDKENKRLHA